jgi:hypothetical protein
MNTPKMGINLANCGKFKNKIWRVDIAMSRAFDIYVGEDFMRVLLNELEEKLESNNITLDLILRFNDLREARYNAVQILKITTTDEEIIFGIKSLEYFYKDVFKNNTLLMTLYLLQDILSNYENIYSDIFNKSDNIENNINKMNKLKSIIFNKIFKKNETKYYIIKK